MNTQRGASPRWCKGCWILLGQPSQLSWEGGSSGNDGEYCPGRSLSHHRCHHRKENQGQGPGHPQGKMKTNWTPTTAYNMEEWMQGLQEDPSKSKLRNYKTNNCGTEWVNACPQHLVRSRKWHRRQGAPQLLRGTSSRSPSSGRGSSDWRSNQSSHQSTMMRQSRGSDQVERAGRGLRVKVNLSIFKDEKTKNTVTYLAVGCSCFLLLGLGWPTLVAVCLLIITGILLRSCQEFRWECYLDWCLADIGQTLHCGDDIQHP